MIINRHVLVALGFLMIAAGAGLFFFGPEGTKLFGIVLFCCSALIFGRARPKASSNDARNLAFVRYQRSIRASWPAAVAISLLFCGSFYLLHLDAASGYQGIFPVILFAFSAVCVMGYMMYLAGQPLK